MKNRLFVCVAAWMSLFCWTVPAAEIPGTLTLQDLVGHPERWPATVTVKANVRTKSGQTVLQGQKVPVVNVTDKAVFVRNAAGGQVGLSTAQCDALEVANARWAKLTPRQRTLDAKTVLNDSSLWPDTVRLQQGVKLIGPMGMSKILPAGHPCAFLYFHDGNVGLVPSGFPERKWFKPEGVDLVGGAMERILVEPNKRRSRLIESVRNVMTDADGKLYAPASLDKTKSFVFFWGANWCGWCHKLSPELANFISQNRAKLKDVTVVMLDGDQQDTEMFKYMKEKQLPWPAIRMADWKALPYFNFSHEGSFPQLLITDRYGKMLYNAGGGGPNDLRSHLDALNKMIAGTLVWTP